MWHHAISTSSSRAAFNILVYISHLALGCEFAMGDVTGGTEKYLGETNSKEDCITKVQEKKPTANAVTYGIRNGKIHKCYAEFHGVSRNKDTKFTSCFFNGKQ